MDLTSYHKSFLNKVGMLFHDKTISNLIFIIDEDKELIENVVFFETACNKTVGFYMNGSNPIISKSRIDEFDDFNLYSLYSELNEVKDNIPPCFKVSNINVVFHPDYNEIIAIYLSSVDCMSSFIIVFSTDEIHLYRNYGKNKITETIKNNLSQYEDTEFLIFSNDNNEWVLLDH